MKRALGLALATVMLLPPGPVSAEGYQVQSDSDWCDLLMLNLLRDFEAAGFVAPEFSDLLATKCVVFLERGALQAGSEAGVGRVPAAFVEMLEMGPHQPPAPAPISELGKKAVQSGVDDPEQTFGLVSGRYRMEWRTRNCEQVDILISQLDGDFNYAKSSRSSYATTTINDLPQGTYEIQQLDPDCDDWTVRVDWMRS